MNKITMWHGRCNICNITTVQDIGSEKPYKCKNCGLNISFSKEEGTILVDESGQKTIRFEFVADFSCQS